MALFRYRAKNNNGQIKEGIIEADSEDMAVEMMAEKDLIVISLKEKKEANIKLEKFSSLSFLNQVKPKDLVIFSRQLSVMISATIPIVQALRTLIAQTENVTLKIIISQVADEVEGGAKLSVALGAHPKIFNNFYINLIKSGETAGQLDEVLNYLADQQEKDYDLRSRIKGAMIYPAFIFCGLIVVGAIMMIFVVPKITDMIKETGGELPISTKILIGTSEFLVSWWWILAIIIIGLVVAIKYYIKSVAGRRQWDLMKIKWPVFGNLFRKIYLVRFTRSLSTLVKGGVSLTQSLEIVAGVINNVIFYDLIMRTAKEVESGNSIATVFLQSRNVPPMLSQMMVIGEKTGKLEEILAKLSDFYTREVNNLVRNLTTLMEPIVMILMGIAVGILVAAIILPMYNMASNF